MTKSKGIALAHERDAAWLLAIYLAVHGGDPAPKENTTVSLVVQEAAALNAISALSLALDEKTHLAIQHVIAPLKEQREMHSVSATVASERLEGFGIRNSEDHPNSRDRIYCFRFKGETLCTKILSPDVEPHA